MAALIKSFNIVFFRMLAMILVVSHVGLLPAQEPFSLEGQVFQVVEDTRQFGMITISSSNNAVIFEELNPDIGIDLTALGFRVTDRLVYGFESSTQKLYTLDATGTLREVATLDLNDEYVYRAGEITADGRLFTLVGSDNVGDWLLVEVDLESPTFNFTAKNLPGISKFSDIAFDPVSGDMYAFDQETNAMYRLDANTATLLPLGVMDGSNNVFGVFFDPFGNFYGYGTSTFGVAGTIFGFRKENFLEIQLANGPVYRSADIASAPYTVDLLIGVDPTTAFPCDEVIFTYTVGNQSGEPHDGIGIVHEIPDGFAFKAVLNNDLGGTVNLTPQTVRIDDAIISEGLTTLKVAAEVEDIQGGRYISQAVMRNLPSELGEDRLSDDPVTVKQDDPTAITVNRIDEDSVHVSLFACLGDTAILDARPYGSNIRWFNGSSASIIKVTESGNYSLTASSGCQSVNVTYEVTVASCPFTIALDHYVIPQETPPCNEVIYRFIIDNDAGDEYSNIDFHDTLPEGISLIEPLTDLMGGELIMTDPNILEIRGMLLPLGRDTLDFLCEVGDLPPGAYGSRAKIVNLPFVIGTTRLSDNPVTPFEDSTYLTVLGVPKDTFLLEALICSGESVVLDGTPFGREHVWGDGSTDQQYVADMPGVYELTVYDGCEPKTVFFNVLPGDGISVDFNPPMVDISLGDSVLLIPNIDNAGDSLSVSWRSSSGLGVDCSSCRDVMVKPFSTEIFGVRVTNGVCRDSAFVEIRVDKTRRLFFPNVFSPNGDGINDYFYVQSPDYGNINRLEIYDRWGNGIFQTRSSMLNDEQSGWDGTRSGTIMPAGVYTWNAEITFLDEVTQVFSGQVTVIR